MANYSRGDMFIRATEVKPFTAELKNECVTRIKATLDELKMVHTAVERSELITRMYATLMEYPEFLAKHHKFRDTAERKVIHHVLELQKLNLPRSQVMEDFVYYLPMLKMRSDYVEHSEFPQNFIIPCVVNNPVLEQKPTHHYNLRPRNVKV